MTRISSSELSDAIDKIPPLTPVVRKLMDVVNNPESSAKEVSTVLSGDEIIASKVLELVNSSFYGLSGQVSTIDRAVVILGNKSIHNLAMAYASKNTFSSFSCCIPHNQFWLHSAATATAAQVIARKSKYPVPEEAFIAGLLHDIGLLIIAKLRPDEVAALLSSQGLSQLAAERSEWGMSHPRLAAAALTQWHFPKALLQAIESHHQLITTSSTHLTRILVAAELVAAALGFSELEPIEEENMLGKLEGAQLQLSDYGPIMSETSQALHMILGFLGIEFEAEQDHTTQLQDADLTKVHVLADNVNLIHWVESLLRFYGYRASSGSISQRVPADADFIILGPGYEKRTDEILEALQATPTKRELRILCPNGQTQVDTAPFQPIPFMFNASLGV